MPQASVLTSTWPADGYGSGRLPTTISPFLKIAARTIFPPSGYGSSNRIVRLSASADHALGDGSASIKSFERLTRSRCAV
jgi:hypothetical protein